MLKKTINFKHLYIYILLQLKTTLNIKFIH